MSAPVIDQNGVLYGATGEGGANDEGTIFSYPTTADAANADATRAASVAAAPSDVADLNSGDTGTSGSGFSRDSNGWTTYEAGSKSSGFHLYYFEPAGAADEAEPKDFQVGDILTIFLDNPDYKTPPTLPPSEDSTFKKLQDAFMQFQDMFKSFASPPPAAAPPPVTSAPSDRVDIQAPSVASASMDLTASAASQDSVTALVAEVRTLISQIGKDLKNAGSDISQETRATAQYTSETATIAKLTTELATQTKTAAQAQIQKKITADDAVQTKDLAQANTTYNAAVAELATISTAEANLTTDYASKPASTVILTGSIASVAPKAVPGKSVAATLTITNSGNTATAGSLSVALSARPTAGGSDISLGTVVLKIHIKAGFAAKEHLSVAIPAALPAGSYSLVAELLSGTPNLIVGVQTFIVS